ncbi:hypothetical protein F0562_034614 [Nyssa sinensis]|uniref:Uncharacterized protein n=1 Tax=Nyssa sinensis TaxID=561372 RepID=A0A5J5AAG4_9ASTE|nr:hypothetical protein F0562_034614 [Nyssa sinensis]
MRSFTMFHDDFEWLWRALRLHVCIEASTRSASSSASCSELILRQSRRWSVTTAICLYVTPVTVVPIFSRATKYLEDYLLLFSDLVSGHTHRKMSTQQKGEDDQHAASPSAVGWSGMIEEQYRKIKENAETYPYVWGSYILVYGGLGLWTAYRWRKLRKTEDKVRVLQERLRKLVEAEESANSATVTDKAPPHADKPPK